MPNPITPDNLKELANARGFGIAQQAVIAAGHWDEHAGDETNTEPRKYLVKVQAEVTATMRITVTARNADEAEELALKDAKATNRDWEYASPHASAIEVEDVRIAK